MDDHLVVALAYDRLCTFEFGCVTELFALERPELGVDWYRFAVCAGEPGPLRAAGGITIAAPYSLKLLDRAHDSLREAIKPRLRFSRQLPSHAHHRRRSERIR